MEVYSQYILLHHFYQIISDKQRNEFLFVGSPFSSPSSPYDCQCGVLYYS